MFIYRVTITIEQDVEEAWLKWMKEVHINDVLNTGYFLNSEIQKLIDQEHPEADPTYQINYSFKTLELYRQYIDKQAPRLQKEHSEKFKGKFQASRSIYRIISK